MKAAFRDVRTAAARPANSSKVTRDLVCLLGLDGLPIAATKLVCRWHRSADGRLVCSWEPDAAYRPQTGQREGLL